MYELEGDIGKIALPTNLARGDAPPMHAWSRSKRGPCGSIAAAAVVCTAHHMALFRGLSCALVFPGNPKRHKGTALRQAESIRLRLAAVAERDPSLDLLLKAVAVMGGSISLKAMTPVWSALKAADGAEGARGGAEPVTEVIQRGIKQRLLKYLAASGAHGGGGGTGARRKSSAAAGGEGSWAFHHLRIQDTIDQRLLSAEARALHRVCAESLEGPSRTSPQTLRVARAWKATRRVRSPAVYA